MQMTNIHKGTLPNSCASLLRKHSTAQHSTAQHSTAQHSTAQQSKAQHSTNASIRAPQHKQAEAISELVSAGRPIIIQLALFSKRRNSNLIILQKITTIHKAVLARTMHFSPSFIFRTYGVWDSFADDVALGNSKSPLST